MLLDGALGEHVRLALQLAVLINDLQRTEQAVGAVVLENAMLLARLFSKPYFFVYASYRTFRFCCSRR